MENLTFLSPVMRERNLCLYWLIMIPTTPERKLSAYSLLMEIREELAEIQASEHKDIVICVQIDIDAHNKNGGLTIGERRRNMLNNARTVSDTGGNLYVSFFDDDDGVTYIKDYLEHGIACIKGGYDVCELRGKYYRDGIFQNDFIHSNRYNSYGEHNGILVRYPNHLNIIKYEIAKQIEYKKMNFGEDTDWATSLKKSGLIKTEYELPKGVFTYEYLYKSNK